MAKIIDATHNIIRGDIVPKIFSAIIHPCEDMGGYWAKGF